MPKDLLKWGKIREQGWLKFVLLYGVLLWGMLSGLLYALITSFVLPKIFGGSFGASFSIMLPVSLGLFGIGGVFWGMALWAINQARWKKYSAKSPA
ncbi:MAG: hypothetical protein V3V30_01495 [Parvularculaceae bacterium]